MIRLLISFWPVLLPLLAYGVWMWRTTRNTGARPRLHEGPWMWTLIAMIAIGIVLFLVLGLSSTPSDDHYVPPHLENGTLVPGRVGP